MRPGHLIRVNSVGQRGRASRRWPTVTHINVETTYIEGRGICALVTPVAVTSSSTSFMFRFSVEGVLVDYVADPDAEVRREKMVRYTQQALLGIRGRNGRIWDLTKGLLDEQGLEIA